MLIISFYICFRIQEQYKFCYEITRLFVDTFSNYANLK